MEVSRLDFLKGPGELGELDEEICAECKATTLNEYKEGQKSIWNELASLGYLDGMTSKFSRYILQVGGSVR